MPYSKINSKKPHCEKMFVKFTEQMLENTMCGYSPRLEEISEMRVDELVAIKAMVRTHPEEVEAWFDEEITKAGNIDFCDILKKIQS